MAIRGGVVIPYHGGPITPLARAHDVWRGRHAFVSFECPKQIALAGAVSKSFALDNGAFSAWSSGKALDVEGYAEWVREWCRHPGFDWCLIPDVIDGAESDNDEHITQWRQWFGASSSVPVWHLHESIPRLERLAGEYPRVALGSSGQFATIGTREWWERMGDVMAAVCDEHGRPRCKLHGLRMLDTGVFSRLPLSSADSTNVARNHVRTSRRYHLSDGMGALLLVSRIEAAQSADTWVPGAHQFTLEAEQW